MPLFALAGAAAGLSGLGNTIGAGQVDNRFQFGLDNAGNPLQGFNVQGPQGQSVVAQEGSQITRFGQGPQIGGLTQGFLGQAGQSNAQTLQGSRQNVQNFFGNEFGPGGGGFLN